MTRNLRELIEKARAIKMSENEQEEQRRSFAYGSAKIENDDITREIINDAATRLSVAPNDDR
jgi:Fic family protein